MVDDDSLYGRVTNPERFQPICDYVRDLIDELRHRYSVTVVHDVDNPDTQDYSGSDSVVRLEPMLHGAAPLTIVFTDFPGVHMRFGKRHNSAYPSCGCDACDEDAESAIREIRADVEALVAGKFSETRHISGFGYELGTSRGWSRDDSDLDDNVVQSAVVDEDMVGKSWGRASRLNMKTPAVIERVDYLPWPTRPGSKSS